MELGGRRATSTSVGLLGIAIPLAISGKWIWTVWTPDESTATVMVMAGDEGIVLEPPVVKGDTGEGAASVGCNGENCTAGGCCGEGIFSFPLVTFLLLRGLDGVERRYARALGTAACPEAAFLATFNFVELLTGAAAVGWTQFSESCG